GGDVAVDLAQRELRTHARVELRVTAGGVRGDRDAADGLLVDAQHAGIGVLRQDGVAADVAVELLGDELARAQRRGGDQVQQLLAQLRQVTRARQVGLLLQLVLVGRALVRALVNRPLVRDGLRRGVEDDLALVLADQAAGVGDLADVGGDDIPLAADLHEFVDLLRLHDRAHALLGLGGEDLRAGHALGALVDVVEHDVHAHITGGSQLGDGTGQACATEVLNTDDDAGVVQVQAALDEDLLREGVADLHGRELALRALLEVLGGQDGHAADAVQAGAGTEEDDAVAGTGGEGQLQILGREHTHAEGVDQWVTAVGSVEDRLAADDRRAEGV